ncbi:hypothetical protein GGR50DRAFT_698952 [Xylaria sp. CBS 124048]|nr:hypothetical protein GGR50DRAFT_698952 [Xylaria sp. CBS 124048]
MASTVKGPSTPLKVRGHKSPSSLTITLVSKVEMVELPDRDAQLIDFGNVILILSAETTIPGDILKSESLTSFICNSSILFAAHFWEATRRNWQQNDVVMIQGVFNPWAISHREDPKEAVGTSMEWSFIMTPQSHSIQKLNIKWTKDDAIITGSIPCSAIGRVARMPNMEGLDIDVAGLEPLLKKGVFLELEYFLRRKKETHKAGPGRGVLKALVFLFFDEGIKKRFQWLWKTDGDIALATGQLLYTTGDIIGQLQDKFIRQAGYEVETPTEYCPIYIIRPTAGLKILDSGNDSNDNDQALVASPIGNRFKDKLAQLKSRRGNSGQSGNAGPFDGTKTAHASIKDGKDVELPLGTNIPITQETTQPVVNAANEITEGEHQMVVTKTKRGNLEAMKDGVAKRQRRNE